MNRGFSIKTVVARPHLKAQLDAAGGLPKTGKVRHFYAASDEYPLVTLVGVCDKDNSSSEGRDEIRENQRRAIAQVISNF